MVCIYQVGGSVRDQLMNRPSKDIDFAIEASSFEEMRLWLKVQGAVIFKEYPEFFTIRAKLEDKTHDYVLCRKEGPYSDGRHPDWVKPGSIFDDLQRRDFTINAIAIGPNGIYDPFNGCSDIKGGYLRCVGSPAQKMIQDPLRLIRALRFCVTHNLYITEELDFVLHNFDMHLLRTISQERIREELFKMFNHNTLNSIRVLSKYPHICSHVFGHETDLWLKPTTEG